MKKISIYLTAIMLLSVTLLSCQKIDEKIATNSISSNPVINPNYSKAAGINQIIQSCAKQGVPGISVAVYDAHEGWWESTAGYAKIEDKTVMKPGHLHHLQSIAKTYMAIAIVKLHEEGRINLDAPINTYLDAPYNILVTGAEHISVRQLLNHTSGIYDYADDFNYTHYLLQHPLHRFTTIELLSYIKGKPSGFEPGSKFQYSNTNYELLALIADHITGNHATYIKQNIIDPLQLNETFYRYDAHYLNYSNLVNSYLDRFSNGNIENVSRWQIANVSSMIGDDGFVATPRDALKLLRGIFEGHLLTPESLNLMTTWVKDNNGENVYGFGLYNVRFHHVEAYGHGGSGIGSGCGLYYIPSKKVYVFMAVNVGTIVEGPLVDKINAMKNKITAILVK